MTLATVPYIFKVNRIYRVIDGDTLVADIDCGFHLSTKQHIRIKGIDCPEMVGVSAIEKEQAILAKEAVEAWAHDVTDSGYPMYIQTAMDKDNFGRWIGFLWTDASGIDSLATVLLDNSLAVESTKENPVKWRDIYLTGN